jgi:actin related protein 2/3 complex subunit 5
MSKNTASNAFRKIDVDQFNEDNFKDEETPQDAGFAGVNESEVSNLLSSGKAGEALKLLLSSAPIGSKNQADKDAAFNLVFRVITSVKQNQVEGIVKTLDNDHKDLLMKYIYRGFENPTDNSSAQLLIWHEKVFDEADVGSIVRVLTDRKRV